MAASDVAALLGRRQQLTDALVAAPYDCLLYLRRAAVHTDLGYPDLAAGDAYRALLLTDEAADESFEYHEPAVEALAGYEEEALAELGLSGSVADRAAAIALRCFGVLARSLRQCGCLRSALRFCERGIAAGAKEGDEIVQSLRQIREDLLALGQDPLPDRGTVRRELYPWNAHEPDRTSPAAVAFLNAQLATVAPKCAVRATELPVLGPDGRAAGTCRQLGLFATAPIAAGEVVLREYTLLTASNRHKATACDACGEELGGEPQNTACSSCDDTVFCDAFCAAQAQRRYHPAVCDKDVDAIAKDPADAREADDALYVLLLARLLAMAAHEERHPLDVDEVKYIWGDFGGQSGPATGLAADAATGGFRGLPFSFAVNIVTPLHILEKMDIDVFATLPHYDLWVLNTLYAKFRGTASARKSHRDGRPDVAAVHPLWCLANHDCAPNVIWEWGGRMVLSARESRPIPAGHEILNHYCDIDLPVHLRREWAAGSLGGWCMCSRCQEEAGEAEAEVANKTVET